MKMKLKKNIKLRELEEYGYKSWYHGVAKQINRHKRNDVLITIDRNKNIIVSYYRNMQYVGIVKYRINRYLSDLIKADLVEEL